LKNKMPLRDTDMDRMMGRLLQTGVLLANAVVLAGGILYLLRHGGEVPDYRHFYGVLSTLKTPGGVLRGAASLQAGAVIQLGLLLMIATPVMRVVFAVAAFAVERDWLYTVISAIVLALLMYGIFGSH
jgi:uncharacterized membrane protein